MSTNKIPGNNLMPPQGWVNPNPTFTILVKETGKRVDGLVIDGVVEVKDGNSSIVFVTAKGKKWKMQFHEFSFVFPAKQAA